MKILLLTETLMWGGSELFTLRLGNALYQKGASVIIINFYKNLVSPTLVAEFSHLNIYHFNPFCDFLLRKLDSALTKFKIDYSLRGIFLSRYIKQIVYRYGITVVHTHLFKVDHAFARINRDLNLRHVITNHGDYQLFHKKVESSVPFGVLNFEQKARIVFNSAHSICCISVDQVKHIEHLYGLHLRSKLKLIYNGFERKQFKPRSKSELSIPKESFVIGMVARGIKEKGWDYALSAFKDLNVKNVHLILVGDGEYLRELKESSLNLENIHWTGYSSNPSEWISLFDIGILPSYYPAESQPSVVFEYLALGKPVICSNVGDIAFFLNCGTENQCGYQIPLSSKYPYINVSALRDSMLKYINNGSLLMFHSENAKQRYNDFTMSKCVELYMNEYKSVS